MYIYISITYIMRIIIQNHFSKLYKCTFQHPEVREDNEAPIPNLVVPNAQLLESGRLHIEATKEQLLTIKPLGL